MQKILVSAFLFITFISCQKESAVGPFNFEKDTPEWLKEKIDALSTDHVNYGAKVYRYEWSGQRIYYILIPIKSCAFCDLYDPQGDKVIITGDELSDFIENRKNEVLVWEWDP